VRSDVGIDRAWVEKKKIMKEKKFWKPGDEKPRDSAEIRSDGAAPDKRNQIMKPGLSKSVLTMKVLNFK
jgi:hypothetical protein